MEKTMSNPTNLATELWGVGRVAVEKQRRLPNKDVSKNEYPALLRRLVYNYFGGRWVLQHSFKKASSLFHSQTGKVSCQGPSSALKS